MTVEELKKALRFPMTDMQIHCAVEADDALEWKFMRDFPGQGREWKICAKAKHDTQRDR
jgi:hypothetical protein